MSPSRIFALLMVVLATNGLFTRSAAAQTRAEIIQACQAESATLRGPGQHETVVAHVRACVQARLDALTRAAIRATSLSAAPFPLIEFNPWLVGPRKGPTQAKGVIYFVGGFSPNATVMESFHCAPYLFKSLAEDGWDIIVAKHPSEGSDSFGFTNLGGAAQTIRDRVAALKAEGYKRVVAGGQSWGGWAALVAARDGMAADALLVSAPNTFGPNIVPATGQANPEFPLVVSEFGPVLDKIRTPTVMILPDDNIWDPDPGARGKIAEAHFATAGVPHLVIARPPGFFGHYAPWLPIFDYAYGGCIRGFLAAPTTRAACFPPRLVDTDFRSIVRLNAYQKHLGSSVFLTGKAFVAYTLNDVDNKRFDYVAPDERVTLFSDHVARERVAFRHGLQCVGNTCSLLVRWSRSQILQFNPRSGALEAWWIEQK